MEHQISQDQMNQLQEKLKTMTPEQVQEFQKANCLFCQITSEKIPSKKILGDNDLSAILDINPAAAGHVLLMPKEHFTVMPQVPEQTVKSLASAAKRISSAMLKGIVATGTNIFIANGTAAGQKAPHFIMHIIPRKDNDHLSIVIPEKQLDEKQLKELKSRLSKKIEQVFGKPTIESLELKDVEEMLGKEESKEISKVSNLFEKNTREEKKEKPEEKKKKKEIEKKDEPGDEKIKDSEELRKEVDDLDAISNLFK